MSPSTPAGGGTFYAYAYLIWGAKSLLLTSREVKAGAGHVRRAAVLYAAFAIEAHASHVSEETLGLSRSQLKKRSWKEKLDGVLEHLAISPDYSARPFKSLGQLYGFRTHHAHGKTAEIGVGIADDGMPDIVDPDWLNAISTDAAATELVEDAYAVMDQIHETAGLMPSLIVISDGAAWMNDSEE